MFKVFLKLNKNLKYLLNRGLDDTFPLSFFSMKNNIKIKKNTLIINSFKNIIDKRLLNNFMTRKNQMYKNPENLRVKSEII